MAGIVPNKIGISEKIGRRIFASSDFKNATREHPVVRRKLFKTKDEKKISTDRLDHASYECMKAIACRTSYGRGPRFKGWVYLVVKDVNKDGREVVYSPTEENPYHADIELPGPVADSKEEEIDHAQALADIAIWYDPSSMDPQPP